MCESGKPLSFFEGENMTEIRAGPIFIQKSEKRKIEYMETIISACISAAVTLVVCLISNHSQQEKTRALMEYKLEELTKRVDKHNNVVKRTYALEQELKEIIR